MQRRLEPIVKPALQAFFARVGVPAQTSSQSLPSAADRPPESPTKPAAPASQQSQQLTDTQIAVHRMRDHDQHDRCTKIL